MMLTSVMMIIQNYTEIEQGSLTWNVHFSYYFEKLLLYSPTFSTNCNHILYLL